MNRRFLLLIVVVALLVLGAQLWAATSAFPDVCKTPTLGAPVPIPYPNTGSMSKPAPAPAPSPQRPVFRGGYRAI
jgi:hypothetical protein